MRKSKKHDLEEIIKRMDNKLEESEEDDKEKTNLLQEGMGEGEAGGETTTGSEWQMRDSKTWDISKVMTEKKGNVTIAVFRDEMSKIYDKDNHDHKVKAVSDIREYLFNSMFPLPSYCKKIAWFIAILWSIAAFITALVYGLRFDVAYKAVDNEDNPNYKLYQNEKCWNTSLALNTDGNYHGLNLLQKIYKDN